MPPTSVRRKKANEVTAAPERRLGLSRVPHFGVRVISEGLLCVIRLWRCNWR